MAVRRVCVGIALWCAVSGAALAQDAGTSATEIKLGQTMPYSGPGSAYGIIGKTDVGFFAKVNDEGGVNGRKVTLISQDDGYNPAKTVELTRQMVERDHVLAIFAALGTAPNSAIQPYLNQKKVPQIIAAGASRFADPEKYPWTISFYPSYQLEGEALAKYALAKNPDAKIGIIFQNDDSGRDYVTGFKRGLGDKAASAIVASVSYDMTDPTVKSQITELHGKGADTVFDASTPKFAAQIIRGIGELDWKPLHLLTSPATSIESALKPGGLDNSTGIVSTAFLKAADSPKWAADTDVKEFAAFLAKYVPDARLSDFNVAYGYMTASIMLKILQLAGNDLSREHVMAVATSLPPTTFPLLLPGITVGSSPKNYVTFNTVRLQRFDGAQWAPID
jgi:branched-chain amino acid transport system substrate-binding protein